MKKEVLQGYFKRGKFVPAHLHLDCCFLLEANEDEELKIKKDENSGVKWFDINEIMNVTDKEQIKPIYMKLNKKIFEI